MSKYLSILFRHCYGFALFILCTVHKVTVDVSSVLQTFKEKLVAINQSSTIDLEVGFIPLSPWDGFQTWVLAIRYLLLSFLQL